MLGFSIMMLFVSAILIFVSISLLKGNYSFVHGKVFDTTDNKKEYAKENYYGLFDACAFNKHCVRNRCVCFGQS